MTQVWKFELDLIDGDQHVKLPRFATVLSFGAGPDGAPVLWAQVGVADEDKTDWFDKPDRYETRTFRVHGTGHPIPDSDRLQFRDTVVTSGGALVWHIFEVV